NVPPDQSGWLVSPFPSLRRSDRQGLVNLLPCFARRRRFEKADCGLDLAWAEVPRRVFRRASPGGCKHRGQLLKHVLKVPGMSDRPKCQRATQAYSQKNRSTVLLLRACAPR